MGRKCVVPYCRSGYQPRKGQPPPKFVPIFNFPTNPEMREKWIKAIPRKNWTLYKTGGVCGKHFLETDLVRRTQDMNESRRKKTLKDQRYLKLIRPARGAVPSLFPLPELSVQQQLIQQIKFFPTLEIKPGQIDEEVQPEEEEFDDKISCIAPRCKTRFGTKGIYLRGVGAYHIPKKPDIRKKWLNAIPRTNWKPTDDSRICSLHFDEDDYLTEQQDNNPYRKKGPLKVRHLKPDAVPHIFTGVPQEVEGQEIGQVETEEPLSEDEPFESTSKKPEKENSKTKVEKTPKKQNRKELKDGGFDINSIMPWKLDFTTNEKEATFWLWEQKWRTFYNFIGLSSHDEEYKMKTLRSFLSDPALELLDTFRLPANQANDIEYVLTALRIHAAKQSSVVNARMNFNLRSQEDHEVFDTFLVDLLDMAKNCEFCECCRDSLIRDRIIIGLKDHETISKLLKRPELNLQQTISICRSEERAKIFSDQDHDPYFDGDPFEPEPTNPMAEKLRNRRKIQPQAVIEFRPKSVLSDIDDHTYSATPKAYFEKSVDSTMHDDGDSLTSDFDNTDQSNVDTTLVSINGDQMIITLEDGSQIQQNVLELNDFQDIQLVESHEEPIQIVKAESLEEAAIEEEIENQPKETSASRESPKKKMENQPLKPKRTFDEYLAELGLESCGVKEKFLCHMCPMEFTTSARMLSHIKNTHEKEPGPPKKVTGGKCKFCDEEFTLMKHLRKHISEVHKDYKPFICKHCPAKFYQGGHLTRHIRILHENERRFACDVCPRKFGERVALIKHKSYVHEQQKCDICKEPFESGKDLKLHMSTVHPQERPHLCDGCGKSFGNQAILNNHVLRVHKGESTKRVHECQACGSKFKHYHFLLYHIQKLRKQDCPIHRKLGDTNEFTDLPEHEIETLKQEGKRLNYDQFPPKCKLCNITFTAVPTLQNHMITVHAKTKDYECGECQKRFKTAKILAQHTQSIHLGMKPYDCPHCPAKFGQLGHKSRHVKVVHQGLKQYVCDSCGKKYASKIDLNNHLKKVHDKGVTFNCPHCEIKYEKKRDLLSHLEEVHENEMGLV